MFRSRKDTPAAKKCCGPRPTSQPDAPPVVEKVEPQTPPPWLPINVSLPDDIRHQIGVWMEAQRTINISLMEGITALRDMVTHLDGQLKGHVGKQVEHLTSELQTFHTSFNQRLNLQHRDHHALREMVEQLCGDVATLHGRVNR